MAATESTPPQIQSPRGPSVVIKAEPDAPHLMPSIETPDDEEEEPPREVYKCVDCTKVFPVDTQLKDHRRMVHGIIDGPYTCQHCGKVYEKQGNLNKHLRDDHLEPDTRPFHCEICGRHYGYRTGLKRHMRDVHPGKEELPPLSCSVCGKSYFSSRGLQYHQRQNHQEHLAPAVCQQHQEQGGPTEASRPHQAIPTPAEGAGPIDSHGATQKSAPNLLTQHHVTETIQGSANPGSDERQSASRGATKINDSIKHRLEFAFQGAKVVFEGNMDGKDKTPGSITSSTGAPLRTSASVDRKRKRDTTSALPLEREESSPEVSTTSGIVTYGLKRAYDKVLGDSFQENIRLKQDNAMLKSENELLRKTISDLQGKKSEKSLTPQTEGEPDKEEARSRVLEKECSLARLNHESARARAQSEMPQPQGHGPLGHATILRAIGHSSAQNSYTTGFQRSQYSQPSSPSANIVRGGTQAPNVSLRYDGGYPEVFKKPFSSWRHY